MIHPFPLQTYSQFPLKPFQIIVNEINYLKLTQINPHPGQK